MTHGHRFQLAIWISIWIRHWAVSQHWWRLNKSRLCFTRQVVIHSVCLLCISAVKLPTAWVILLDSHTAPVLCICCGYLSGAYIAKRLIHFVTIGVDWRQICFDIKWPVELVDIFWMNAVSQCSFLPSFCFLSTVCSTWPHRILKHISTFVLNMETVHLKRQSSCWSAIRSYTVVSLETSKYLCVLSWHEFNLKKHSYIEKRIFLLWVTI